MRSGMKTILAVVIAVILCCVAFGGYIVYDNMQTSIKGLYACGDCVGGLYQISKAVYDGTKAGMQVKKDINKNG